MRKPAVDEEWQKLEKLPAMQMTKVRSKKKGVIQEAQKEGRTVPFAALMDGWPPQELEVGAENSKNTQDVFVLQGDTVKDDSGPKTVFTEQGSSASQMTAAKFMDVFARPPGCAGRAAGAVSANAQVQMEDAPELLKNSKVRMSRYVDTSFTIQRPQIMGKH